MDRVIYLWLQGGIALAHLFARAERAGGEIARGEGGGKTPVAPAPGSVAPGGHPEILLVCHQGRLVDASCDVPGLRVGEKRSRLAQLCPGALVVAYDAGVCGARARDFWDLAAALSPVVEPEAENRVYLGWNTAWPERLEGGVMALAEKAVPALGYRLLGAVASSKVVARGAVQWLYETLVEGRHPRLPGAGRPNRLVSLRGGAAGWWLELDARGEAEFWASLSVRYLWPLPEEVLARCLRLGLYRIGDVAALGEEVLSLRFGALGSVMARLARGEGPDDVQPRHPPERVERQLSFPDPVYDYGVVARGLRRLAQEAGLALQQKGCGARELVLEVEWEGGVRTREERRLPRGEGDPARLALLAGLLWERLLLGERGRSASAAGRNGPALPVRGRVPGGGVRAVRVVAGGLEEAWYGQLQLFPGEQPSPGGPAGERLQAVLESLREKYAREVVRVGMTPTRRQLMLSFYA